MSPFLFVHICAATIALLAGALSMTVRKGSGWHAAAGNVYFVSMLTMAACGAYIAAFLHPIMLNVVVSLLTIYLVSTSWRAARRREGTIGTFDTAAMLFALAVGLFGVISGWRTAARPEAAMLGRFCMFFGTVALLCAAADVRMLVRGGFTGARRIARHLWRMSFSFLIAMFSLYPGQGRLFPKSLRATNLLFVPHILIVGSIVFWMYRMSRRKRAEREEKPAAPLVAARA